MAKMDEVKIRTYPDRFPSREPSGTVLMHGKDVRFFYANNDYFDVRLEDGGLKIHAGGVHLNHIAVVPEVANEILIRPRTWNPVAQAWEVL